LSVMCGLLAYTKTGVFVNRFFDKTVSDGARASLPAWARGAKKMNACGALRTRMSALQRFALGVGAAGNPSPITVTALCPLRLAHSRRRRERK